MDKVDRMDKASASNSADVDETLTLIKRQMPDTYVSIRQKAKEVGNVAFSLVRRGIRGEANCFWACERGYVVGAPFRESESTADFARFMVQFGHDNLVIWGREAIASADAGVGRDGTN